MIIDFLRQNWFFVGIAVVIIMSFSLPELGRFVRDYSILNIGIFLAFFITGLTIETSGIGSQLRNYKALFAAMLSSLLFFPIIARILAGMTLSQEFLIGVCIIAVAPVTVASGVVMTSIGRGNVPLALFICVLGNLLAIFTIPISLSFLLRFEGNVDLPVLKMLFGLMSTVLLPTILGQIVRPFVKQTVLNLKKPFSIFQQCIVLLIIFNAVASSTNRIIEGGTSIIILAIFMVFLHLIVLAMNFGISKFIHLDRPSTTAFTIQTSQKTLTVSYIVWAGYFATQYPMALIPAILYHLTQMIIDTIVAERFRLADIKAKLNG